MNKMKESVIYSSIKKVRASIEVFNTVAFECEHVDHQNLVKEMVTGISYPGCRHRDAVGAGYIDVTARCDPDRCPFGREI